MSKSVMDGITSKQAPASASSSTPAAISHRRPRPELATKEPLAIKQMLAMMLPGMRSLVRIFPSFCRWVRRTSHSADHALDAMRMNIRNVRWVVDGNELRLACKGAGHHLLKLAFFSDKRWSATLPGPSQFVRADGNQDGLFNIADPVFTLSFLFPAGAPPTVDCFDALDANDDGLLNIADAVFKLSVLFPTGPPPSVSAPFPNCRTTRSAGKLVPVTSNAMSKTNRLLSCSNTKTPVSGAPLSR